MLMLLVFSLVKECLLRFWQAPSQAYLVVRIAMLHLSDPGAVSVLACPADTIRSKLMNNGPSSPQPLYKSFRDCVVSTWRSGGITAYGVAMDFHV